MPSAPQSRYPQANQTAQKLVTLLGPEDGTAPALTDEVDWLLPQRLTTVAGGGRDDVMSFVVDLARKGARLRDTTTPIGFKRQVEVRSLDENGKATNVISWGFLATNPQRIDTEESTQFEARLTNAHFGVPLTSYPVWDAVAEAENTINRPLIFNPEIDEIIQPNMSDKIADAGWHYIIDPESVRTEAARTYQQQTASDWSLSEAVLMLCWLLNPDETYIKNPTEKDVSTAFNARSVLLKNVTIAFGSHLPDALDQLLTQFEYGWYLKHTLDKNGARVSTIRFYPRGEGPKKQVTLQAIGETRDIRKTNVKSFDAEYSIFELANRIEVYGDYLKREDTFVLKKGWATTHDSKDLADLEKGQPYAELHPAVGRKWVLNEGGDYIGLRTEITDPYDLDSHFPEHQTTRRRRFTRCLSQHPDADDLESNAFRVDWYDEDQDGATDPADPLDPGWVRVKWPFSVLEKECGILFEGVTPPDALWALMSTDPTKARVRITATITGDQRLKGVATRQDRSPNGIDVPLVLDLADRFQFSQVFGIYDGRPSIARDDSTVIQTYAEKVRDIEDACKINCSILLEGIAHPQYQIGDLIDNVTGRNLTLNGYNPSGGANARNPQIVGFTWHLAGTQQLEIMLDSFKRERPQVVMDNHQKVLA